MIAPLRTLRPGVAGIISPLGRLQHPALVKYPIIKVLKSED